MRAVHKSSSRAVHKSSSHSKINRPALPDLPSPSLLQLISATFSPNFLASSSVAPGHFESFALPPAGSWQAGGIGGELCCPSVNPKIAGKCVFIPLIFGALVLVLHNWKVVSRLCGKIFKLSRLGWLPASPWWLTRNPQGDSLPGAVGGCTCA